MRKLTVYLLIISLSFVFAASLKSAINYPPEASEILSDIKDIKKSDPTHALEATARLESLIDMNKVENIILVSKHRSDIYKSLGNGRETLNQALIGLKIIDGKERESISKADLKLYSEFYENIATAYYYLNKSSDSKAYNQKSVEYARMSEDPVRITYSLISSADIYDVYGDYEKAMETLGQASKNLTTIDNRNLHGMLHSTKGNIYISLEKELRAIDSYKKAIEFYEGNKFVTKTINQNIASALFKLNRKIEAYGYLLEVVNLSKELKDHSSESYAYFSLGEMFRDNMQWHQAVKYYMLSVKTADKDVDNSKIVDSYIYSAASYAELDKIKEASAFLEKARKHMGDDPLLTQLKDWYYYESLLLSLQGKYRLAYNSIKNYAFYDYETLQESSMKNVNKLRELFDTKNLELEQEKLERQNALQKLEQEKLERQNTLQKLELEKERTERERFWYVLFICLIALSGLMYAWFRQRQLRIIMTELAIRDELTGLHNRRAMGTSLQLEFERYLRCKEPFCVALIDFDFFKRFNDCYGHHIGDLVLINVSSRMSEVARNYDTLSRWGGEEFLLLLPNSKIAAALKVGERLLKSVKEIKFDGLPHYEQITFSMGVVQMNDEIKSVSQLVHQADVAAYKAKSQGRARVEKY